MKFGLFTKDGERYGTATFDDIAVAKALAKNINALHGPGCVIAKAIKDETPKASDDEWIKREERLMSGRTLMPWVKQSWFYMRQNDNKHFAHVSQEGDEKAKVRFIASSEHGRIQRYTLMTIGRYLTKFYSDALSEAQIKDMASEFSAEYDPLEVQFAATPEEIVAVYTNGPNSCMAARTSQYQSDVHPTYVYGAGDLAVAYLKKGKSRATARTLCWPKKKVYSSVYGDSYRLEVALQKLGYTRNESALQGARILRRMMKESSSEFRFVVPHIDGIGRVRDEGDALVLDRNGEVFAASTSGVSELMAQCSCGTIGVVGANVLGLINGVTRRHMEYACYECAQNKAWRCGYSGRWVMKGTDEGHEVNGTRYSSYEWAHHSRVCVISGERGLPPFDMTRLANGTWALNSVLANIPERKQCSYCGYMLVPGQTNKCFYSGRCTEMPRFATAINAAHAALQAQNQPTANEGNEANV